MPGVSIWLQRVTTDSQDLDNWDDHFLNQNQTFSFPTYLWLRKSLCFPSAPKFRNPFSASRLYSIQLVTSDCPPSPCQTRWPPCDVQGQLTPPYSFSVKVGTGDVTTIWRKTCQTSRVSFSRARLFCIKHIAGTLRSHCSPCSAKAATFMSFKPVKSNFGSRGRTSTPKRYQT